MATGEAKLAAAAEMKQQAWWVEMAVGAAGVGVAGGAAAAAVPVKEEATESPGGSVVEMAAVEKAAMDRSHRNYRRWSVVATVAMDRSHRNYRRWSVVGTAAMDRSRRKCMWPLMAWKRWQSGMRWAGSPVESSSARSEKVYCCLPRGRATPRGVVGARNHQLVGNRSND